MKKMNLVFGLLALSFLLSTIGCRVACEQLEDSTFWTDLKKSSVVGFPPPLRETPYTQFPRLDAIYREAYRLGWGMCLIDAKDKGMSQRLCTGAVMGPPFAEHTDPEGFAVWFEGAHRSAELSVDLDCRLASPYVWMRYVSELSEKRRVVQSLRKVIEESPVYYIRPESVVFAASLLKGKDFVESPDVTELGIDPHEIILKRKWYLVRCVAEDGGDYCNGGQRKHYARMFEDRTLLVSLLRERRRAKEDGGTNGLAFFDLPVLVQLNYAPENVYIETTFSAESVPFYSVEEIR